MALSVLAAVKEYFKTPQMLYYPYNYTEDLETLPSGQREMGLLKGFPFQWLVPEYHQDLEERYLPRCNLLVRRTTGALCISGRIYPVQGWLSLGIRHTSLVTMSPIVPPSGYYWLGPSGSEYIYKVNFLSDSDIHDEVGILDTDSGVILVPKGSGTKAARK